MTMNVLRENGLDYDHITIISRVLIMMILMSKAPPASISLISQCDDGVNLEDFGEDTTFPNRERTSANREPEFRYLWIIS